MGKHIKKRRSYIIGRYGYTEETVNAALAQGKVWCSTCKNFLEPESFGNQKLKTRCKLCQNQINRKTYHADPKGALERRRIWEKANPEKLHARNRRQNLRMYGVDEDWYNRTLASQDGRCCLCPRTSVKGRRYLFIDHDHKTGKVRGLLCDTCNFHLHSIEKAGWAELAMAYLRKHGSLLDGNSTGISGDGERAALPDRFISLW